MLSPSFGIVLPLLTDAGAKELAGFGSAAVNGDGVKALARVADRYAGAATIFAVAVLICAAGWSASTVLRAVRGDST